MAISKEKFFGSPKNDAEIHQVYPMNPKNPIVYLRMIKGTLYY